MLWALIHCHFARLGDDAKYRTQEAVIFNIYRESTGMRKHLRIILNKSSR